MLVAQWQLGKIDPGRNKKWLSLSNPSFFTSPKDQKTSHVTRLISTSRKPMLVYVATKALVSIVFQSGIPKNLHCNVQMVLVLL